MIEILFLIILKIFFSIFIFPNVILALRAMMFYISTIHAKRDQTARPTSEKRNQSKFFVIIVKTFKLLKLFVLLNLLKIHKYRLFSKCVKYF